MVRSLVHLVLYQNCAKVFLSYNQNILYAAYLVYLILRWRN